MLVTDVHLLSKSDMLSLGIRPTKAPHDDVVIEDIFEEINKTARATFENLSLEFDMEVHPWEQVCIEACQELVNNLPRIFKVENKWYDGNEFEDTHMFLFISYGGSKYLVDPTYQQYLSLNNREYVPLVMICPITNKEELIESLFEHNIDEEFHHIWVDTVFEKDS